MRLSPSVFGLVLGLILPTFAMADQSVTTSEIIFDSGGRPSALVTVNDTAQYVFVIDSAAQRTTIGPAIVADFELQPDPDNQVQVQGAAGIDFMDLYRVASIEIGRQRAEDGIYIAAQIAHGGDDLGHDGILGQDFFAGSQIQFDFENRRVSFGALDLSDSESAIPVDWLYSSFALIEVQIDGVDVRAIVDTGAAHSIANFALMEALGLSRDELEAEESIVGITQHISTRYAGFASGVRIAETTSAETAIEFSGSPIFRTFGVENEPALILGMDVLSLFPGFALDYQADAFYLLD